MEKWHLFTGLGRSSVLALAAVTVQRSNGAGTPSTKESTEAGARTRTVVDAANAFLNTLGSEQRSARFCSI